jgi:hypothetical protein
MSIPNWWGDWRQGLTPHTGNLQSTDLIECTQIVGGQPVNTAITGQQIIDAASGGSSNPSTIGNGYGLGVNGLANTISATVLIPANSIATTNTIYIKAFIDRTNVRGATFLGSAGIMSTSVRFQRFERNIYVDLTNMNCFNTGTSSPTDYTTSAISLIPLNKTVDNYLIFTVQHSSSATDIAAWKRITVQKYA